MTETPPQVGYYRSREKRVFDAIVTRLMLPGALLLMKQASTALRYESAGNIITQKRFGWHGALEDIWKIQSLDRPDYASIEEAQLATAQCSASAKVMRDFAIDELPQLFQVSIDPDRRGALSLVAARPLMESDHVKHRAAIGSRRYNDWFEVTTELMGPGVYSYYGSCSSEALRPGAEQTTERWMERYEMDMLQFEHGSLEVDNAILISTFCLGGVRAYHSRLGIYPPEMATFLSELGNRR